MNDPATAQDLPIRLDISDELNPTFRQAELGSRITVEAQPLFGPGESVFAVGSCFAQSIREALDAGGHPARPAYETLDIDLSRQMAGPVRHINYYTTFGIKQEFERVLSDPGEPYYVPIAPGLWPVTPGLYGAEEVFEPWDGAFQDPLRHGVVGATEDDIIDVMAKVDTLTRNAVLESSAYVITLGMIESWIDRETGMHMWSSKVANVAPDRDRYQFHMSDYQENHDNLAWVCETIAERFPGRQIVLTVSPVCMLRTFTGKDVITANSYGKSVLRSVAGAMSDAYDHVTYWPTFELAMRGGVYEEDGRHIERHAVEHVIQTFINAFASPQAASDGRA